MYNPRRSLQSEAHSRLVVLKYTNNYGKRFPYAAPVSWNGHPENIKRTDSVDSFKNLLKHIFSVVPMGTLSSFLTVTYFKLFEHF